MASIFKRAEDKQDKKSCWMIAYTDHEGRRRTRKGFRDKGLTEQLAAKLENEAMLRKTGLIDVTQERLSTERRLPIEIHLQDFEERLKHKGNTERYVKLVMQRVRWTVEGANITSLADLTRSRVEQYLASIRGPDGCGNKTHNHYAQAMTAFGKWLLDEQRIINNPLQGLPRLNVEVDVRRPRRALTPEEAATLVAAARNSTKRVQTYSGEERARIYTFSFMTGLRRSELATLTLRSFELDAVPPTLKVEAAASKHRKTDVLPLHAELVKMLKVWTVGLAADEPIFPKLDRRKTWVMVQHDLAAAGIPYQCPEAKFADFHAARRHSFITALLSAKCGATLTEARELARHGDIRMTMRDTHIGLNDQATALAALPVPASVGMNKTADTAPLAAQRNSSAPAVPEGLLVSWDGEVNTSPSTPGNDANPCNMQGFDAAYLDLSHIDHQRGRRDSNPQPPARQAGTLTN